MWKKSEGMEKVRELHTKKKKLLTRAGFSAYIQVKKINIYNVVQISFGCVSIRFQENIAITG